MLRRHAVSAVLAGSLLAVPVAALPASAAAPAVEIVKVYYDSPGADRRSNSSLNAEYVTIKNITRRTIDLEGWTIRDKAAYRYTFGPIVLKPGKTLTLRTGQGDDGTSSVFWNRRAYVWNNDTDTASLRNASGKLIDSCSYNSTRYDYTNCR
ncbi:lamin tail domain-containing protein [Planomonospora sp. ID82291]|uniref:lamin tail domain-containing protein n=1 Tax=Planomonospora sp. ID82291 TaxID=2738136 RepID=UPI0027DD9616|nr:lamin tail domain-containing protein [Planomonospora sp. ID82291]